MRNWLLIQLICWSVQGAIPQRDWAVREMGPGTFRNTSKMMDFFWVLWRETLRLCLETCCYDVLFLFRWFEGFNWDGLCERTLTAPVIPKVRQIQYWLLVFTAFHVSHFFFISVFFRSSILWEAVHLAFIPRTRWSRAQTGMISEGFLWTGNKILSDTTSGLVSMNNWLPTDLLPLRIHYSLRQKIFSAVTLDAAFVW